MVEDSCYCIDVLTQINAVRAAPHKVEAEILPNHVTHRVGDAFATAAASTGSGRR
jgi:DNA-binding FrmR family transcriptional regulator